MSDLEPPVSPHDHAQGPADAPVTLVEFGDYECADCMRAWHTVRAVRERLGDEVRFVFRHLPQPELHPHAVAAAQAAEAAAAQGRFWEMHERLFARNGALAPADLRAHAAAAGLDVERFTADLAWNRATAAVDAHVASARASRVEGTPAFFLNGRRYRGGLELSALLSAVTAERARVRAAAAGPSPSPEPA